ncbi:hypothetical protein [EBPR siphovirus 4]|nr:hypothetical protein [EBPR siphovirus 4]
MTFEFDFTVTMSVIVAIVLSFIGWIRSIRKSIDDAIGAIREHQSAQELRLGTVEQVQQAMPTKDDLHQVNLAVEGLRGDIRELRAHMEVLRVFHNSTATTGRKAPQAGRD